jgi:Mrp family chromosome partitioning ATPase
MSRTRNTCAAADEEGAARARQDEKKLNDRMDRIGQKLLVMSGKGGVGKSTVAVNLALTLARAGHKVGLLDVDIHGPSVPRLLGLKNEMPDATEDLILPRIASDHLAVMSIGFLLKSPQDAVIWRGPRKYALIRQFLRDVLWGNLDVLVIDAPPGTGDEPLAVVELAGMRSRALLVTTPQDLAISDVRRSIGFCRELGLPVAGLIENMSGYVCPHCGRRVELFGSGGGEALAREMGVKFLGRVPIDPEFVTGSDAGKPFVAQEGDSPARAAFSQAIRPLLASVGTVFRDGDETREAGGAA